MLDKNAYSEGEYVIYHNESTNLYEIGRVCSLHDDGAFVAYGSGETAAKTPYDLMHKLINAYCITNTLLGGARFSDSEEDIK